MAQVGSIKNLRPGREKFVAPTIVVFFQILIVAILGLFKSIKNRFDDIWKTKDDFFKTWLILIEGILIVFTIHGIFRIPW